MPSEIEWIKITTGMFEDEKIEFIETLPEGDAIISIWIRLLCMAGKCNAGGYIFITEKIPYTVDALASKFRKPINVVKFALETLKQLDMVHLDENDRIAITNWAKHQNVDGMEKIREQNRLRVAAYREKKKQEQIADQSSKSTEIAIVESESKQVECNVTVHDDVTRSSYSYSSSDSVLNSLSEEKNSGKKEKPKKHKNGSQQNVLLTDSEKENLEEEHGKEFIAECIEFYSLYKAEKDYKSKSDNLAIRRWVLDAVKERRAQKKAPSGFKPKYQPLVVEYGKAKVLTPEERAAVEAEMKLLDEGVVF